MSENVSPDVALCWHAYERVADAYAVLQTLHPHVPANVPIREKWLVRLGDRLDSLATVLACELGPRPVDLPELPSKFFRPPHEVPDQGPTGPAGSVPREVLPDLGRLLRTSATGTKGCPYCDGTGFYLNNYDERIECDRCMPGAGAPARDGQTGGDLPGKGVSDGGPDGDGDRLKRAFVGLWAFRACQGGGQ